MIIVESDDDTYPFEEKQKILAQSKIKKEDDMVTEESEGMGIEVLSGVVGGGVEGSGGSGTGTGNGNGRKWRRGGGRVLRKTKT
jgi:hypothetical protein